MSMTILEKGILTLIKSSITGEKYELPEGFSMEAEGTRELIKKHHFLKKAPYLLSLIRIRKWYMAIFVKSKYIS